MLVQSETRSIAVQSIGPQHGGAGWPTEALVLVIALGLVAALSTAAIVVVVVVKTRARRAAGSDNSSLVIHKSTYTCAPIACSYS